MFKFISSLFTRSIKPIESNDNEYITLTLNRAGQVTSIKCQEQIGLIFYMNYKNEKSNI